MTNSFARKSFTRLRISAHNLRIETGRHTYPKTAVEDRLCRHCDTLDDELHFILKCSKSTDSVSARQTFMTDLAALHPDTRQMNDNDKFKFIMSSEDLDTCLLLQKLIVRLVKNRGSL